MNKKSYILILLIAGAGCKERYAPPAFKNPPQVLVVEGVINSSSDYTVILLSRTVSSDSSTLKPVSDASVTVESDNGNNYLLTESAPGTFYSAGLNLDVTRKYRLRIKTLDLIDEYVSDFVPVKPTPPIDSVGFTVKNDGLQIYTNTHDPTNNTRYYRWDYQETWAFHSQYYSSYYSDGISIVSRPESQQIYNCFHDQASTDIVFGSSAKLKEDVIYQNPVVFIPSNSEKLETKYSILVRQYALTSDAFAFWTNLRKNTEELGTIFDVQPSNTSGNIHSIFKSSEPVIGYVSASTVTSKRIFISKDQLPQSWQPLSPYTCVQDSFFLKDKSGLDETKPLVNLPPIELVTEAIVKDGITVGYLAADAKCVDCTLRGSTAVPYFWK